MPIGGETIGRAYVRIIGDGSGLPDDVKKALGDKDLDKAFEQAGERHSEKYTEARLKRQKDLSNKIKAELVDSLTLGAGDMDTRAKNISRGLFTSLQRELRARFTGKDSVIADQIWQNILGDYKRGAPIDAIKRSLNEDLPKSVERATKQIKALQLEYLQEAHDMNARFDRDRLRAQQEMLAEAYQMNKDFNARNRSLLEEAYAQNREFDRREAAALKFRTTLERAYAENKKRDLRDISELQRNLIFELGLLEKGERRVGVTRSKALKDFERLKRLVEITSPDDERLSTEIALLDKRLKEVTPRANRFNRTIDSISTRLGRSTGRGSRNDFLHVIGGVTEGISRLLFLGPKLITNVVSKIGAAFTGATGAVGKFSAVTGVLATMAGQGLLGLAGLAVAAGVLVIALGPLVALMSGLLGIVTALAATLSFALLGGLVALAGVMVPLAAGIGVAVLGLTQMSDTLKDKLGKQIEPVKDAFKELGRVASETLTEDVGAQAKALAPILESLEPPIERISRSLSDVATGWLESMSGAGFNRFVNAVSRSVPSMIRKLGEVADNTAGALGGMFVGAIPFLQDFLDWLVRITDQWSDWANSVEGTKEFRNFLDQAADSAEALGGFLESVLGLVVELFDAGSKSGDNIFDDMSNAIENLTTHLEDNPDALKEWFSDAEDLADDLGDLVVNIIDFFAELNNDDNQQALSDFLDLLGDLPQVLSDVHDQIEPVIGPLLDLLGIISDLYELSTREIAFDISISDLLNPIQLLDEAWQRLRDIDWSDLVPDLNWDNLIPTIDIDRLLEPFRGLGARIMRTIGDINWQNLLIGLPAIPGLILGFFTGMAGRLIDRHTPVPWGRLIEGLASIPGRILGFFTGMAGDIIDRILPVPWSRLAEGLTGFITSIPGMFAGLGGEIADRIGDVFVNVFPRFLGFGDPPGDPTAPGVPGGTPLNPNYQTATGGLFSGGQWRVIGEAGPEAVVPLDRPLSAVDPSVRWLSAIAQGLVPGQNMAMGGRGGKSIDASGWTIVSPQSDPRAVATEALNYLVATSFTA